MHRKKNGTLDMRYKSSKMAVAAGRPVTKSGRPDMRFKQNRTSGVNANGTVDRRFGPQAHLKKDGTPDMRYAVNRNAGYTKSSTNDPRFNQQQQRAIVQAKNEATYNRNRNIYQQTHASRTVTNDNITIEPLNYPNQDEVSSPNEINSNQSQNDTVIDDASFTKAFQQKLENDIMKPKPECADAIDALMKYYVDGIVTPEAMKLLSQTNENQTNEQKDQTTTPKAEESQEHKVNEEQSKNDIKENEAPKNEENYSDIEDSLL